MRSIGWGGKDVVGCADGDFCNFRNDVFLVTGIKLQIIAHVHELCTRLIICA